MPDSRGSENVPQAPSIDESAARVAPDQMKRDICENKRPYDASLFLAAIVESSGDSIVTVDFDGVITSWNKAAESLYGYTAAETIGHPLTMLTMPSDLQQVLQNIECIKQSKKVEVYDTVRLHKDGREMNLEIVLSPVKAHDGQVIGVSTVAREVTERRKAEEARRLSETRFAAIFSSAPIGLSEISLEGGRFQRVNPKLCELLGRSSADLLNLRVTQVTHPNDLSKIETTFRRVAKTGETESVEKRCVRSDGVALWTCTTLTRLDDTEGRPVRFLAVTEDITGRREAEFALLQSQERLRLIIENARDYAIFTLDLDRKVTTWNAGAERLVGWSEEEILGLSGDVIFTTEDQANGAPQAEAAGALQNGRAADERWHVRKDGTRFWGSGSMMSMHGADGMVIGFVKIFRDETEVRNAKEALEQSRQELWEALQDNERARAEVEAAAAAKDHFLAVLSHELRTPLTPVLMTLHMLKRQELPENVRESLEMIRRNVAIEAQFIDELLDVTKISRGKLEIAREPLDLHAVVHHAVGIAKPDIDGKSQQFTIRLEAAQTQIVGDSTRLQQAIWNLLKNASKFTPERGSVTIRSFNEPGQAVVQVTDNGMGIEPQVLARIFDPFAQGGEDVTRRYGGLGLGLAIAKAVADAHGGVLSAESAGRGKGATFSLRIPLA